MNVYSQVYGGNPGLTLDSSLSNSGTPADFGKIMESEVAKWKKVVEFSGATVE